MLDRFEHLLWSHRLSVLDKFKFVTLFFLFFPRQRCLTSFQWHCLLHPKSSKVMPDGSRHLTPAHVCVVMNVCVCKFNPTGGKKKIWNYPAWNFSLSDKFNSMVEKEPVWAYSIWKFPLFKWGQFHCWIWVNLNLSSTSDYFNLR